jgi:hypothetical protein
MSDAFKLEFRYLLRPWLICVSLPIPVLIFWRSDDGAAAALWFFFIGCASLVARAVRRNINPVPSDGGRSASQTWRRQMTSIAMALFCAFVVFSLLTFVCNRQDASLVFVAFLILIPSICIVPCLTLIARSAIRGVVFTLFLEFCMKLLGCVVVVLVYGWSADVQGQTAMPWTEPNLLVWLFWLNSSVLCTCCYLAGARRFLAQYSAQAPARVGLQQLQTS